MEGSSDRAAQRLAARPLVVAVALPVARAEGETPRSHTICAPVYATGVGQDLGAAGHRPGSPVTASWSATPSRPSRSIRWSARRPRSRARSSSPTPSGTLTAQVAGNVRRGERRLPGDLHEPHRLRVAKRGQRKRDPSGPRRLRHAALHGDDHRPALPRLTLLGWSAQAGARHSRGNRRVATSTPDEGQWCGEVCGRWREAGYEVAVKAGNREKQGKKWCAPR